MLCCTVFQVNWHPVFWGLSIQYIFALLIIRTSWGFSAFDWLGDRVTEMLAYSNVGAAFVFGEKYTDHIFAMKVGRLEPLLSCSPVSVSPKLNEAQTIRDMS